MSLLIFLGIAGVGFLVLMIMLIFGGDHDVEFDHDFDLDHDVDVDTGSGHHWLSIKVIAAFMTAFGGGGAIGQIYGLSVAWSILIGMGMGIVVAAVVEALISFFYSQQSSSLYSVTELTGKPGTVTLTILPGRIGEVAVQLPSANVRKPAHSQNPTEEIKQGEPVIVVSANPSGIIVKKPQTSDLSGERTD